MMRSHEAAWVAELLILLPEVDLLSVRVDSDTLRVETPDGVDYVPMLGLDVHAKSWEQAEQLAESLHLPEVEGHIHESQFGGRFNYRNWRGWAHEGSREAACLVKVTAAEVAAQAPVAGVAA